MSTYSVYNIHIDNNLSFTPGATAGYVLAIDENGNTYWAAGGSGGSGSAGTSGSSGTSGVSGSSGQTKSYYSTGDTASPSGNSGDISIGVTASFDPKSPFYYTADYLFNIGDYVIVSPLRDQYGATYSLTYRQENNYVGYICDAIINAIYYGSWLIIPTNINGYLPNAIGAWSIALASGTSGSSGINGQNGQSSSLFLYKAKTNNTSGNPDHEYILWNNATQTGATAIHINHLTQDNIDIDIFLGLVREGSNITIQHRTNSAEYQIWNVNGSPTLVSGANNYWIMPVDLIDSTVSFTGNENIFVSLSADSGTSGTSGTSGVNGATGSAGSGSFGITIDGGGSAITTGVKGYVQVPYSGTITGWTLLSDVSGSIVIDVWKDTFATFPPSVADTIAGSEKPTLTSSNKSQDNSLSTWTTSITAGDIIAFNVDSASTLTRVNLAINITKS